MLGVDRVPRHCEHHVASRRVTSRRCAARHKTTVAVAVLREYLVAVAVLREYLGFTSQDTVRRAVVGMRTRLHEILKHFLHTHATSDDGTTTAMTARRSRCRDAFSFVDSGISWPSGAEKGSREWTTGLTAVVGESLLDKREFELKNGLPIRVSVILHQAHEIAKRASRKRDR